MEKRPFTAAFPPEGCPNYVFSFPLCSLGPGCGAILEAQPHGSVLRVQIAPVRAYLSSTGWLPGVI